MLTVVMPPARALEAGVANVHGVDGTHVGIQWTGPLIDRTAAEPDVRMGVDQSGHHHFSGDIPLFCTGWNEDRSARSDRKDFAALDHQDTLVDRAALDWQNARADESDGLLLRTRVSPKQTGDGGKRQSEKASARRQRHGALTPTVGAGASGLRDSDRARRGDRSSRSLGLTPVRRFRP